MGAAPLADPSCREQAILSDQPPDLRGATGRAGFLSIFPSIVLPMFLAIVDQTIVSTALPEIAASLGKVQYMSWVVVGYLVANTIAAPVYGRLGDLFGRRKLMLGALVMFGIASVCCALSTSMEMLVLSRVLQGLGGGGLITLSQALISEVVAPRERVAYQGYLATVGVTANAVGPVIGGYLTEHFGWRAIFLVNLPLDALGILLLLRLPASPGLGERRPFDLPGLLLLSGFVAATLIGFSQSQRVTTEGLSQAAILLAVAGVSLALLLRHEGRTAFPLLPVKLIGKPAIWRSDGLAACHGAAFVSLLTFIPIYLYVVHRASPAEIGLLMIPLSCGVGAGSLIASHAVSRTGRTAIFPSLGLTAATVLLVLVAVLGAQWTTAELSWLLGVVALLMGPVMGVVQVTVQGAASPRVLGAAAATVQLSRSIGAAVGTGLVSLALFATLALSDAEILARFRDLIQHGPEALAALAPAERARFDAEVRGAFVAAFVLIAGFTGMGAALAWTLPVRRL